MAPGLARSKSSNARAARTTYNTAEAVPVQYLHVRSVQARHVTSPAISSARPGSSKGSSPHSASPTEGTTSSSSPASLLTGDFKLDRSSAGSAAVRQNIYSPSNAATSRPSVYPMHQMAKEEIGRAVTSPFEHPRQSPPAPSKRDHGEASLLSESDPTSHQDMLAHIRNLEEAEQKISRWKTFGGLLGRKASSNPSRTSAPFSPSPATAPFYPPPRLSSNLSRRETSQKQKNESSQPVLSPTRKPNTRARSKSSPEQVTDLRPDVLKSKNATSPKSTSNSPPKLKSRPSLRRLRKPMPRDNLESPKASQSPRVAQSPNVPELQVWAPPTLDIDIPSVEMERYSVMFGNLLQSETQPSLLARRQANLDKIKGGEGTVHQVSACRFRSRHQCRREAVTDSVQLRPLMPPRSIMSAPGYAPRSPSFSLFPSTPTTERDGTRSVAGPSPLSRAMTSPSQVSPKLAMMEQHNHRVRSPSQFVFMVRSPPGATDLDSKWSADNSQLSVKSSVDGLGPAQDDAALRNLPPKPPSKPPGRLPLRSPGDAPDQGP